MSSLKLLSTLRALTWQAFVVGLLRASRGHGGGPSLP